MNKKELHLTIHMKGKLKGILSINTSSLKNPFCNSIGCRHLARKDRKKKTIRSMSRTQYRNVNN